MISENCLYSFPKEQRLLSRKLFLQVNAKGERISGRYFIVIKLSRLCNCARIGVTASRKVGGSVQRNYVKRMVRECYRQNKLSFDSADYSVIAKRSAVNLNLTAVTDDILQILQRFKT